MTTEQRLERIVDEAVRQAFAAERERFLERLVAAIKAGTRRGDSQLSDAK